MIDNKLIFSFLVSIIFSFNSFTQVVEQNDSIRISKQPKDTTLLAFNTRQYQKMISKSDVYFSQKDYEKSKKMYERAIRFQPNWDNDYPKNRIIEIDKIVYEIAQSIEVFVKEYNEVYRQGITEERTDLKFNNYGKAISYEVARIVVIGKQYTIYKKYVIRSITTYSKNGVGVTKQIWNEESNNITLTWN